MALSVTVASARWGVAQAPHAADSVTIRIVGTELRSAVQIMQQYLDRPVIFVGASPGPQVTLETPRPVPRADVVRYLRGLLDAQGYELVNDTASGTYRARLKESAARAARDDHAGAADLRLRAHGTPAGGDRSSS